MAVIWKAVIFTLEGAIGFFANLVVIIVMLKHSRLMGAHSSKFILNQSLIDALTSVMIIVSHTNLVKHMGLKLNYTDNNVFDEIICKTWRIDLTIWSFVASSTCNLVVLTIDRYINIVHPFFHKKHITGRVQKVALVFPWIFGPAFQLVSFTHMADVRLGVCKLPLWKTPWAAQTVGLVSVIVEYLIPLAVMVYCYSMILYTLRRRWQVMKYAVQSGAGSSVSCATKTEDISTYQGDDSNNQNNHELKTISSNQLDKDTRSCDSKPPKTNEKQQEVKVDKTKHDKSEKKVIKLLLSVCLAFFLCFFMNQLLSFLTNTGLLHLMYGNPLYTVSVMIAFVNCLVNPFIYVIQYKNFRGILWNTLRCR